MVCESADCSYGAKLRVFYDCISWLCVCIPFVLCPYINSWHMFFAIRRDGADTIIDDVVLALVGPWAVNSLLQID
jgi:hypothetical protein